MKIRVAMEFYHCGLSIDCQLSAGLLSLVFLYVLLDTWCPIVGNIIIAYKGTHIIFYG